MPPAVADLVDRALAGFEALAATAEPIADEYQYVTDLGTVWRARLRAVADARGAEPAPAGADDAIDALVARGRPDRRPPPGHRLALDPAAGRARGAGRARLMHFADARPDGRAVVYAHIQADPLVARGGGPARRGVDDPAPARAGRDERRVHRPGDLAGDVPVAVRAGGARAGRRRPRPVRGDPRRLAARRRPRRAGPQPVPRRDRRGADRAAARGAHGPSGAPRAPDPVRRPAGRDPPLRRHGRARGRRRGVGLQVGRARDQGGRPAPARRRAARRGGGRHPPASSAWSCSTRAGRARSGSSASAARWRSRASG